MKNRNIFLRSNVTFKLGSLSKYFLSRLFSSFFTLSPDGVIKDDKVTFLRRGFIESEQIDVSGIFLMFDIIVIGVTTVVIIVLFWFEERYDFWQSHRTGCLFPFFRLFYPTMVSMFIYVSLFTHLL
jgi:hypothetical protein